MILPGSYLVSILLLALSFVCWGSWANALKATDKKWRFELWYFDFAIGAVLAALGAALTLGTLGWDGFSFLDDLVLAGKRQDVFALGAGVVFNLGNMLIVGALSTAGMSVAFPVGYGLSLLVSAIWAGFIGPEGNPVFRYAGAVAMFAAAILAMVAYRSAAVVKLVEVVKTGKTRSTRKSVSMKPVLLALLGSVFLGSYYPLLQAGSESEIGLGPYTAGFLFAVGILFSTFVFNLFFMNLPVEGEPVDMLDYFKGKATAHAAGILGGIVWYAGTIAVFVCEKAEGSANAGPALTWGLSNGSIVLAALWGIVFWKELSSTDMKVNYFIVLMLFLMVAGLGLLSFGQIASAR